MAGDYETFEGIHLNLSRHPGKCRFAASGMGWKSAAGGDAWVIQNTEIASAQWSRAAKGYEVKINSRTQGVVQLDGFEQDVSSTAKLLLHPARLLTVPRGNRISTGLRRL